MSPPCGLTPPPPPSSSDQSLEDLQREKYSKKLAVLLIEREQITGAHLHRPSIATSWRDRPQHVVCIYYSLELYAARNQREVSRNERFRQYFNRHRSGPFGSARRRPYTLGAISKKQLCQRAR